jgi:hypothetical protein
MSAIKAKKKGEHHYWRVTVTYSDNETSGNRVFKGRDKAEESIAQSNGIDFLPD